MPLIKICGLTRPQDIDFVNEALPNYIGFVFAKKSKRYIAPEKAETLQKKLNPKIVSVGVFVNENISKIVDSYNRKIISIVQLHGEETPAYITELKSRCSAKIIKAVSAGEKSSLQEKLQATQANYFLLDSKNAGSGISFDWNLLKNIDLSKNCFLAGGVNLHNIDRAIALNPFAVDVSSGAETDNVKDREKILQLVKKCHSP